MLTSSAGRSIPAGQYVIKRISIDMSEDVLRSAATEVKILEQLEPHENIVQYFEHFFDDEGTVNIVMEHCVGGDLESVLKVRQQASQPLRPIEAIFLSFQLLVAVRHLHRNGILHRDLKPANVFVCYKPNPPTGVSSPGPSGTTTPTTSSAQVSDQHHQTSLTSCTLKLADFGISRVMERTASVARTVVGTPFYIAPEQCNGEAYGTPADMWALGCIVYELGSMGRRCFQGENLLAVVRSITSGTIPPLQDHRLQGLLMPMIVPLLQAEPARRFTAEDALKAFFAPPPGVSMRAAEEEFVDPDDDVVEVHAVG